MTWVRNSGIHKERALIKNNWRLNKTLIFINYLRDNNSFKITTDNGFDYVCLHV